MTTTDHARELLEGLHLQAHEGGPTTDLSTHFRRAERLWAAQRDDQEAAGFTDWVTPWADMNQAERLALAGLVARVVQDVLEVEQVMFAALDKVLRAHTEREWRRLDGMYLGGTVCDHCRADWPCHTARTITTALEGKA